MSEVKKSIEKWLEGRLEKTPGLKTKRLLREIDFYFFNKRDRKMPSEAKKFFVKKIKTVRQRVKQRRWKQKRKAQKWAEELGVPVEVIDMLVEKGFVKDAWDVKRLKSIIDAVKKYCVLNVEIVYEELQRQA